MSQYWMKAREPISSFTHMLGAVFFAVATVLLIGKTLTLPDWSVKILVGVILFGCSLVALYAASSIYHFFNGSGKKLLILRKLDHAMIYVLIAGTYTPLALCSFREYSAPLGWWIFGVIWLGRLDFHRRHLGLRIAGHCDKIVLVFCAALAANGFIYRHGLGNFI